MWLSSVFHVKS
jgi:hypothetical protein